tara:strand:- start:662 stop:784 length:123 start_codon:yes stop_codon:yes gene_type:complete
MPAKDKMATKKNTEGKGGNPYIILLAIYFIFLALAYLLGK